MNADACFQIGKDHKICEDYALAGTEKEFAYAIVCDGCSASKDVDLGARLLALSSRENLLWGLNKDCYEFGEHSINLAKSIVRNLMCLGSQCLDATLLIAVISNKNVTVYIYGDGVLVHQTKDEVKSVHINLTSGAPDYLTYIIDKPRIIEYDKLEDNRKIVWTSYDGIHDYKPFEPFVYKCQVEDGDVISVISDGINSFRKADNEAIDWKDLLTEFTGFKNFEGEFVQRRISAFKRKIAKDNWHHLDDISIASIIV